MNFTRAWLTGLLIVFVLPLAEVFAGGVMPATDGVGVGLFYERPRRTMRADDGQRYVLEYDHFGLAFAGNFAVALASGGAERSFEADFQYGAGAAIRNYRDTSEVAADVLGFVGAGVPIARGALMLGFGASFDFSWLTIEQVSSTAISTYNFTAIVFNSVERFEFFFFEATASMMVSYWTNRDPATGDFFPIGAVLSIGYAFSFAYFETNYFYRDALSQPQTASASLSSTNNHFLILSAGLSIGLTPEIAIVPVFVDLWIGDHTYFLVGLGLYF